MTHDTFNPILNVPVEEIEPIANQILDTTTTIVGNLQIEKIGRSNGEATMGIYRVVGHAKTSSGTQSWSAVVKVLKIPEESLFDAEAHLSRELAVYRSGVFTNLCGGIRAARCYAIQQQNDLQLLWLEDLSTAPQAPWLSEYYIETARHLGQFNAYWSEQALPKWDWLSQERFAQMFESPFYSETFKHLPMCQSDPLISRVAHPDITPRLINLWDKKESLFGQVEATPKGICHLDCHPKNLFPIYSTMRQTYTIAIDWAAVGVGCLGIDIGHLLGSPITWLEISLDQAKGLVEPIFDAYLSGLKDAGWQGDVEQVKLTYLTRLGCEAFRIMGLTFAAANAPQMLTRIETLLRLPIEEVTNQWNEAAHFLLSNTDQAFRLANHS